MVVNGVSSLESLLLALATPHIREMGGKDIEVPFILLFLWSHFIYYSSTFGKSHHYFSFLFLLYKMGKVTMS
jgi:hypothetical protein